MDLRLDCWGTHGQTNRDMMQFWEWVAVALNVSFVVLIARNIIWGWLPGIMGSLISSWLFYQSLLYSECILYLFYAFFGLYGWWSWSRPQKQAIVRKNSPFHTTAIAIALLGGLLLGTLVKTFSSAQLPMLDAFSTSFSFVATWLEAKKILRHWIYWIGINVFSIWLYSSRGLDILAMQMVLFSLLSIWGWFQWKKTYTHP